MALMVLNSIHSLSWNGYWRTCYLRCRLDESSVCSCREERCLPKYIVSAPKTKFDEGTITPSSSAGSEEGAERAIEAYCGFRQASCMAHLLIQVWQVLSAVSWRQVKEVVLVV